MCCFKVKVIPDTIAVNSDLSKSDLIVIGTTNGNIFLSKHFQKLPILITEDKIIADKEYFGTNLQLITSWINPFNDKRSMMIYTAQNAKDLIKCNRIPYNKGITIAKSNKVIKYGVFKNPDRVWVCE